MSKVIFLHNKAINYRLPLFHILSEWEEIEIEFWFTSDQEDDFPGKYFNGPFKHLNLAFALLRLPKETRLVVSGANSLSLFVQYVLMVVRRFKYVFWTETWDWGAKGIKDTLHFWIVKKLAKRASVALYPGKLVKDFYLSIGVDESDMLMMPDASANLEINPDAKFPEVKRESRVKVAFVGRLMRRKGVEYLVEAGKLIPEESYAVYVVGSGDEEYLSELKEQGSEMKNITFLPYLNKEDVGAFLKQIDIFVYPSINLNMGEPWGLILNEVLSVGKPVVATETVAAAHDLVIEGKNGFLVPERDSEAIAKAIESVTEISPSMVEETSKQVLETFSYDNMAQAVKDGLLRILK